MVLQAALGSLLLHQEKVGRFRAVLSYLHGPGEVLYDGTWHAAETLLWTLSLLESECMVPALRDMKPFLSNLMKAHTFAIKAQLLHFEMYGAPGYSALGRKCPISGCHRAQGNDIKWASCSVWDLDFKSLAVCPLRFAQYIYAWYFSDEKSSEGEGEDNPNLKHIFLLPAHSVSGAFLTIFIWCCVTGIVFNRCLLCWSFMCTSFDTLDLFIT